jgi:hypothetical protein
MAEFQNVFDMAVLVALSVCAVVAVNFFFLSGDGSSALFGNGDTDDGSDD